MEDDEDFDSMPTKKGINREQQQDDLRRIAETEDIDELIALTASEDPLVRQKAAQ